MGFTDHHAIAPRQLPAPPQRGDAGVEFCLQGGGNGTHGDLPFLVARMERSEIRDRSRLRLSPEFRFILSKRRRQETLDKVGDRESVKRNALIHFSTPSLKGDQADASFSIHFQTSKLIKDNAGKVVPDRSIAGKSRP
jgi:hypothetical protein